MIRADFTPVQGNTPTAEEPHIARTGLQPVTRPAGLEGVATAQTKRVLALSSLALAGCLFHAAWCARSDEPRPCAENRIDPNTAPWWELTVLPGIGPELAHRIVDFRTRPNPAGGVQGVRQVFESGRDLDLVLGLGPNRVARVTPHLRFGDPVLPAPPRSMDEHGNPQEQQE